MKRIPNELKERIRNEAIDLYLKGLSKTDISYFIKDKYKCGSGYALGVLSSLPYETKVLHFIAMVNRRYEIALAKYGEERAKKEVEKLKKIIEYKTGISIK